jgi:uncharacterized membrane protein YfcA
VLALLGAAVGLLGGLLGLGGAEFRLPILVALLGYSLRRAIPLNLAISFLTSSAALVTRLPREGLPSGSTEAGVVVAMLLGAMAGAHVAAGWLSRISARALSWSVGLLLSGVGGLLLVEGLWDLPGHPPLFEPAIAWVAALVAGLAIGAFASFLGVAGGELIIPTLTLLFGFDLKLAGTASLVIGVPSMAVGLRRHARAGAFLDSRAVRQLILPMGVGSVLGAAAGGALVAWVSTRVLKVLLGLVLLASLPKVVGGKPG